jgi:signal transduction histidine kinase
VPLTHEEEDIRIRQLLADMALFPEMNPGPVCRLDRDGKVLLANSKAKRLFGSGDLVGRSWFDLCPGMNASAWSLVLSCGDVHSFESKIGDIYMVFNHVCPPNSENIFVYGTDITANKLIEQKLEEQKAIVAEVARFPDMNPGPVIRMDFDSIILLSNAAASAVFGEDMLHKKWKEICPPMTENIWQQILASHEVFPVEARIGNSDFVFNHRTDPRTNLVFVFGTDITLQRLAERSLHQTEKMATLGTLAAGIAHELNNPAAATKRYAQQLREAFTKLEQAQIKIAGSQLTDEEYRVLTTFGERAKQCADKPMEIPSLRRTQMEMEIEDWLEAHDVEESWTLAPDLISLGFHADELEVIAANIRPDALKLFVVWVAHLYPVYLLLNDIGEGSSRISEIVVAMKNYSYLGQAPIQNVNIHEGIDNTLIILRSKLKEGITVTKEYAADLPAITAYGSELNQAWTNLLDNAADAMGGKGEITIRTKKEQQSVVVEIEDTGPGIPPEVQSRIFDPFFTTKAPGKGTGLGLSTTYGIIVEKHKGTIKVNSQPGRTRFIVTLPISQ